jgi:hypothetical protein
MIEYPSIINSSKAPRANCVGFAKIDGSNFRAKYTQKQGFNLFGTRRELINDSHPIFGEAVTIYQEKYSKSLTDFFKEDKETRNEREILVFGEYYGYNSYAGTHVATDKKSVMIFDVMVGHKNRHFYKPYDFIETFQNLVEIPPVLYMGNMNDQLIQDVREGKYTEEFHRLTGHNFKYLEGMVCKGTLNTGAFCGNMWQCKIKTLEYLNSLKERFGAEWEKYAE